MWSWSLSLRLVYPVLHKPPGATITPRSAVRIQINFWRMVGLYISFGDWANALECWRSPSLRLVIPGIAVFPGVTHSDSRIVFVTGTVVKPQQPTASVKSPRSKESQNVVDHTMQNVLLTANRARWHTTGWKIKSLITGYAQDRPACQWALTDCTNRCPVFCLFS